MFQALLTTHDVYADSGLGSSISTDDRSSCRFSDSEEVGDLVHNYAYLVTKKLTRNLAKPIMVGVVCYAGIIMSPQALII